VGGGTFLGKKSPQFLLDYVPFLERLVIPKPHDTIAFILQPTTPCSVGFREFRMLAAVEFEHQLPFQAHEIHDERSERMLSAKLKPAELAIPNPLPHE
jgi:hypothetical protein